VGVLALIAISLGINLLIFGLANKNIAAQKGLDIKQSFWLGLLGPIGMIIVLAKKDRSDEHSLINEKTKIDPLVPNKISENPNVKKEELPTQKIVESKPEESNKESTETQQNSFESWKQLQSAKDPNYKRFSKEGLKELYEQEKLHENKKEPEEQKLGTNTDYLNIIMPEKPNEKKEELPTQKIVESKPVESKPRISSTKPNFCGDCGASLASAKNFCANCGKKL